MIRSARFPKRIYVGVTYSLKLRLNQHNTGLVRSTSRFRPWNLLVDIRFDSDYMASDFEKYLKSGSGVAFLNKHFVPHPPVWLA